MRTLMVVLFIAAACGMASAECGAPPHHAQRHGPSASAHAYLYAPQQTGHVYAFPYPVGGGYGMGAPKPAYAYGWFGVAPRRHKCVQYGYYWNYTQWSYQ